MQHSHVRTQKQNKDRANDLRTEQDRRHCASGTSRRSAVFHELRGSHATRGQRVFATHPEIAIGCSSAETIIITVPSIGCFVSTVGIPHRQKAFSLYLLLLLYVSFLSPLPSLPEIHQLLKNLFYSPINTYNIHTYITTHY